MGGERAHESRMKVTGDIQRKTDKMRVGFNLGRGREIIQRKGRKG